MAVEEVLAQRCLRALVERDMRQNAMLQGVPGWPVILAAGCAAYQFNSTHVQLLPYDVREALEMGMSTAAVPALQGFWALHRDRRSLPEDCQPARLNLTVEQCLIRSLVRTATMLSLMTEAPFHLQLKEHTQLPRHDQFKLGGPSGQFGFETTSGMVAIADSDHLRDSGAPASTAVEQTRPGKSTQDLVLAYARSLLRPSAVLLNGSLPELATLTDEIEHRSHAVASGTPPGVVSVQLSFSCVGAWLTALAASSHPPASAPCRWCREARAVHQRTLRAER